MSTDFKQLKFGYASAEKEGAFDPELVLQGYYDHEGLIEEARNGEKCLFLGPKGTGKSSIGQRLQLESASNPKQFVTLISLRDFPFKSFGQVAAGVEDPESRYPSTWAWLLYLFLIDSFTKDESRNLENIHDFERAANGLKKSALIPIDDLKNLVIRSSKTSFKAGLPKLFEAVSETATQERTDQIFFKLVAHLRATVRAFRSSSRHILVIDGLDDILTQKDLQYRSLAALVQEVDSINMSLMAARVPAKIVLLCRTDLFERLPDGNKNKVRRDSAVTLDWYENTRQPELSSLIRLADLRVAVSTAGDETSLLQFLPQSVENKPMVSFLLDLTRHTPRDLLQLLLCIQRFAEPGRRPTVKQVLNGARAYSVEYFVPELQDELVGAIPQTHVAAFISIISAAGKRTLQYEELAEIVRLQSARIPGDFQLEPVLSALYQCSAIGVINSTHGRDSYSFKFRNRYSDLGMAKRIILHRGVWKALNLA